MVFNSASFLIFLAAVLAAYFFFGLGRNWKWQNFVLLFASYAFYGFWDARFLALLFALTVVNYAAGWAISLLTGGQWVARQETPVAGTGDRL